MHFISTVNHKSHTNTCAHTHQTTPQTYIWWIFQTILLTKRSKTASTSSTSQYSFFPSYCSLNWIEWVSFIVFIIYCIFWILCYFFQFQNFPFLNSIYSSGGSISMCVCRFLQYFQFFENSNNISNVQTREEVKSYQLPIRCVLVIFQMNFLSNFSQVFNVKLFENCEQSPNWNWKNLKVLKAIADWFVNWKENVSRSVQFVTGVLDCFVWF